MLLGAPLQVSATLDEPVVRLVLAAALGLFLGLEREWSRKPAGIRTFSLTSLAGAAFTLVADSHPYGAGLLVIGGAFVVVQSVLLAVEGLRKNETDALQLTTSVSLLVAYAIGVLVAAGSVFVGVAVAVTSSLLLVLKRELHSFAGERSREEIRSATEFAILAFVAFPLLPAEPVTAFGVDFEARVAWLMVVTVAGIGIANYAIVRRFGGRGLAVTGFFGGLASSTAVVGSMLDYVRRDPSFVSYGVAAVLLADAAMALRNLSIALVFTLSGAVGAPLFGAVIPLGVLVVAAVAIAYWTADWDQVIEIDLESPFSLRNALVFGIVFLAILAVGTVAQNEFGTAGLYVSSFVSGLVSSGGSTTTAVLLYRGGAIDGEVAVISILLASAASVVVKTGLTLAGPRVFATRVARWSLVVLVVATVATALVVLVLPGL